MLPSLQIQPADQPTSATKRPKYFVSQQETITIKCHTCGRKKTYSVAHLKDHTHSFHISCPCTATFDVDLEFRQEYRRQVHIAAHVRFVSEPPASARPCIIADQSNGGLLLTLNDQIPVQQNDTLIVAYRPDHAAHRDIERMISVRHFNQLGRIGGAFVNVERPQQRLSAANAH